MRLNTYCLRDHDDKFLLPLCKWLGVRMDKQSLMIDVLCDRHGEPVPRQFHTREVGDTIDLDWHFIGHVNGLYVFVE